MKTHGFFSIQSKYIIHQKRKGAFTTAAAVCIKRAIILNTSVDNFNGLSGVQKILTKRFGVRETKIKIDIVMKKSCFLPNWRK